MDAYCRNESGTSAMTSRFKFFPQKTSQCTSCPALGENRSLARCVSADTSTAFEIPGGCLDVDRVQGFDDIDAR